LYDDWSLKRLKAVRFVYVRRPKINLAEWQRVWRLVWWIEPAAATTRGNESPDTFQGCPKSERDQASGKKKSSPAAPRVRPAADAHGLDAERGWRNSKARRCVLLNIQFD
jgi:hypothetical protein